MTPWVCVLFLFQIILSVLLSFFSKPKKELKSLLHVFCTHVVIQLDMPLNLCATGANAVEFIINHAEVSIAFVQDSKIPSVSSIIFLVHKSFIVSLVGI